jgi:hypothetical protein
VESNFSSNDDAGLGRPSLAMDPNNDNEDEKKEESENEPKVYVWRSLLISCRFMAIMRF